MRRTLGILIASSLPLIGACGYAPTEPSDPTQVSTATPGNSTASQIVITAPRSILSIGSTATLTATATMSDGTRENVGHASWRSDADSVIAVDAGGNVTAVGAGEANVVAEFNGQRGVLHLVVLPDYEGRFEGTYMVASCTATEDFETYKVCDAMFPPNSGMPYDVSLALALSGNNVSGHGYFEDLESTLAPVKINPTGSFTTTSSLTWTNSPIAVTWNVTQTQAGRLDGNLAMVWTHATHTGKMTVIGKFQDVVKAKAGVARTTARSLGWKNLDAVFNR